MALIRCPECGKEISDKAEACPNCGYPIAGLGKAKRTTNEYAVILGCKDEREVFMKMKTAEFYKALTYYYGYYFGWAYVYKEYKLIFNQEIIKEEIPEVEVELQKELLNT